LSQFRIAVAMACLALALAALGCAGLQLKYDPAPAPDWIAQAACAIGPTELSATGAAPCTTNPQRDLELATRDGKARIARFFQSEISARSFDWSLTLSGGKADADRSLVQQSTTVRSNVNVEDAAVEATYRDEPSRTQYVHIRVDRVAWAQRLKERVGAGQKQLEGALAEARMADEVHRPLNALAALLRASAHGQALGPDVLVLDLIDRRAGAGNRLTAVKAKVDELGRRLRQRYRFALQIDGPNPRLTARVRTDLAQFLADWGFAVNETAVPGRDIQIQVTITQQPKGTEQIADRTEFIHGASATLGVHDADGTGFPGLAAQVEPGRYQQRDPDQTTAINKALDLAADTICAKFRSAFRNRFSGR
jgi:hypothetical protein